MSEVFEGVWFRPDGADTQDLPRQAVGLVPFALELQQLPQHGLASITVRQPRVDATFGSDMERVAELVSAVIGSALLVRLDQRTGFRATVVYQNGHVTHVFGPASERWVRIDADGNPITDGPTYSADELDPDPDAEYATLTSALDLGFQAFGAGSREILDDFIYAPDGIVLTPQSRQRT